MTTTLVTADGSPVPKKYIVVIGIPSQDVCQVGFAHDLARLAAYTASTRPDIQVYLVTSRGTLLPQQRATIVKEALSYNATHLLWLDSDMRFPKDTLVRLLAHNEPIVAANYVTRRPPIIPTAAHNVAGLEFTLPESEGIVQVDRAGMGCMLTDLDIFRNMPVPWFALGYLPKIDDFLGEDIFFCQKAAHHGYAVLIDHTLSKEVAHLGEFPYQYTHALQTRDALMLEVQQAALPESTDGA